jgi:hypothetical protein
LPSNSKTQCIEFPRAKPLAYWASSSVTKKNCFIGFPPGVNVIQLSFFLADNETK